MEVGQMLNWKLFLERSFLTVGINERREVVCAGWKVSNDEDRLGISSFLRRHTAMILMMMTSTYYSTRWVDDGDDDVTFRNRYPPRAPAWNTYTSSSSSTIGSDDW